ncbi:MAG TPA: HEAT repeat domain-containing protein [Pirellulales bacterium]|jgi:putative heme-binding domain-containing protein
MHSPVRAVAKLALIILVTLAVCSTSRGPWAQNTLRLKVDAGEPQWIWSAARTKDQVPQEMCYFRKVFNLSDVEQAKVQIACDDRFDLFVNGRLVGNGTDWKKLRSYDVQRFLESGKNAIAIRAENTTGGSAGLVARVTVKQKGGTEVSYSTDATWKTNGSESVGWEKLTFNDEDWALAQSFGELGSATPWTAQVVAADGAQVARFTIAPEFRVERVLGADTTGSLIAMAFNEFGEILASQERGPLLVISDNDQDGIPETVSTYSDELQSCQGILALNGNVFAVGQGPDGPGLYRLSDENQDRKADSVKLLLKFKGDMHEHGPHAPVLGPDGLIYIVIGNHTSCLTPPEANSPYHNWYEGDLVQPRYEDAGGHAVGVKAPGGVVLRTDTEGSFAQVFAGGFRNAYDIAFNRQGDLFSFDSDMEWDEGLPWYRPTRINHVTAGAEFGWRSGWANWPEYFFDSLPATKNVGRGSPTGVVVYNHYMMPARYHNALFACDWAQGRILAVKMTPARGTYEAKSEVFLEGRPLNVTDIEVGPDGWLYFCTGGRGTDGGIYRVVWTGKVPPRPVVAGAVEAIYQPQLDSAWARQKVATIQQKLGPKWNRELIGIAENVKNKPEDRARALDLMQLVGPFPTTQMLVKLSRDRAPEVRTKAAYLMGLHSDGDTATALVELLKDSHPTVQRVACESIVRSGVAPPVSSLLPLLANPSRYISWTASRAIEQLPTDSWRDEVISSRDMRVFLVGSAALMALEPDADLARTIVNRSGVWMKGYVNDPDFIDLLRLMQIAMHRGQLTVADIPQVAEQLEKEYPSQDATINRELLRLLVHLQQSEIIPRLLAVLKTDAPLPERIHAATHARFLDSGWTTEQKLELLEFYEHSRDLPGGHSYALYLDNFGRDFLAKFSDDERRRVLARGEHAPSAALTVLGSLEENPGEDLLAQLIDLDARLQPLTSPAAQKLRTGIIAVLARSGTSQAMAFLRERYELEPNRRQELAICLAQQPDGENWAVLVRAIPILEGAPAREVLQRLATVDQKPTQPEAIRQVILSGLKLRDSGAQQAAQLLTKWTSQQIGLGGSADDAMASWQAWFQQEYPDQPAPNLPTAAADNKWTAEELVTFLTGPEGSHGNRERGQEVFDRAQCVKCHRYGSRGEGVGPDLTTVSQRFQAKEIVESVIYPSQVISDQYASKTVQTERGMQFTGIVGEAGVGAVVVLQSNGEKITVPRNEIHEIVPSQKSAMPEGLLNAFSLEEIADLFAYLSKSPKSNDAVAEGVDGQRPRIRQR